MSRGSIPKLAPVRSSNVAEVYALATASSHSEHRFLAPSSKLCQIYLRHWRDTLYFRAAVHRRGQRPPKALLIRLKATYRRSTHVNMKRTHTRKKTKKQFRLDSNDFGFIWAGISNMVSYETNFRYNLSCL